MSSGGHALYKSSGTLLALVAFTVSSACAVKSPPQILNSTGGAAGTQTIALVPSEQESALRASFRENLKTAFKDRAIAYSDKAKVIGDFAISISPADVELASTIAEIKRAAPRESTDKAQDQTNIVTQSAARKSRLLDKCEAVRFRASLALFDSASGERFHRAESEAFGCKGDRAPLRQLSRALVGNAVLSPR